MELRDLIVSPLVLMLVYAVAYRVRPWVTDGVNYKYFFPALTLKILGALSVGFIYQFYYGGGDTFGYHTHGSRVIWEVFIEDPIDGLKLIFMPGNDARLYSATSKIWFFDDPSSYFIVRITAAFDLLTFSSYSATAILFAVLSFSGVWVLFRTLYEILPQRHFWVAVAVLFVPSVFFWGSGLLKDSLTLSAVGWATFAVHRIFVQNRFSMLALCYLLVSIFVLYSVKLYILLCFVPAATLWVFLTHSKRIRPAMLKIILTPLILVIAAVVAYQAIVVVGEADKRYAIENIARTAWVTAYDIGFYTGRSAGSPYSLGEHDGTLTGLLSKAPQAINVTLFRPYVWEVNNVLMLVSSLESLVIMVFTLYVLWCARGKLFSLVGTPVVFFALLFSLTFAFAVGISTYNFGTLVRYKIPLIPFFLFGLIYIWHHSTRRSNVQPAVEMPNINA